MVPEKWSVTDKNFSHFGPFFALLPPSNAENRNFGKRKKMPGDFVQCTKNHMQYCVTDVIFIFHFELFFALLPLSQPKK